MGVENPYITVTPQSIKIGVGEAIQVQVDTNVNEFDIVTHNESIIYFDLRHYEIKGLSSGFGQVDFIYKGELGNTVVSSVVVTVEEIPESNDIEYMFHNRATNRLTTLKSTKVAENNIHLFLPSKDGELATSGANLPELLIRKPTIIEPKYLTKNYKGLIKTSEFEDLLNAKLIHTHTEWQISTNKEFTNIIHSEIIQRTWFYNIDNPDPLGIDIGRQYGVKYTGQLLYYRCRYYSNNYISNWSDPVLIEGGDLGDDNLNTLINGDLWEGGYFGIVPPEECISRDYRGEWTSLCSKILNKNYTVGQNVNFHNRLWKCIKNITPSSAHSYEVIDEPGLANIDEQPGFAILREIRYYFPIKGSYEFDIETSDEMNHVQLMSDNLEKVYAIGEVTKNEKGYKVKLDFNNKEITVNLRVRIKVSLFKKIKNSEYKYGYDFVLEGQVLDKTHPDISVNNPVNHGVPESEDIKNVFLDINPNEPLKTINLATTPNRYEVQPVYYDGISGEHKVTRVAGAIASITRSTNSVAITAKSNGAFVLFIFNPGDNSTVHATQTYALFNITGFEPYWELDNNSNLPTQKWVEEYIGIGTGVTDNNIDQTTFGSVSIGKARSDTASIQPNTQPWTEKGWHKFAYQGKLFYIPVDGQTCDTIAHNDLLKREAVLGNRTFRWLNRTYKVRLLTKEEFKYLHSVNKLPNTTSDILLWDSRVGAKKYIGNIETGDYYEDDPKARKYSWVIVIEPITNGNEPFYCLQPCVKADNEIFQYDPWMDVGYFGDVPDSKLVPYSKIHELTKVTSGTPINEGSGYHKFYWHGLTQYITQQGTRQAAPKRDYVYNRAVYRPSMGEGNNKSIKKDNVVYDLSMVFILGKLPSDILRWYGAAGGFAPESGRNSMYFDCVIKLYTPLGVVGGYPDPVYRAMLYQIGYNFKRPTSKITQDGYPVLEFQELDINTFLPQPSVEHMTGDHFTTTDINDVMMIVNAGNHSKIYMFAYKPGATYSVDFYYPMIFTVKPREEDSISI